MYDRTELCRRLNNQPWKFAKTMPYMPHFHVWYNRWTSSDDFKYCVHAVSEFGKWEFCMIEPRHYFYDDVWRYWWLNGRNGCPIVINRERITVRSPKPIPDKFKDMTYHVPNWTPKA